MLGHLSCLFNTCYGQFADLFEIGLLVSTRYPISNVLVNLGVALLVTENRQRRSCTTTSVASVCASDRVPRG